MSYLAYYDYTLPNVVKSIVTRPRAGRSGF